MKIRNAVESDVQFISDLEVLCWGADGASFDEFYQFVLNNSKSQSLQIIESSEGLIGYIGYSLFKNNKSIDIWNLAISPKFRKKGYAQFLVGHVISQSKFLKINSISLKVSETNISNKTVGSFISIPLQSLMIWILFSWV